MRRQYLNGEKNGKRKEYYKNGKIRFEGEYLNDVRIKGKEYYIFDGELEYEGEYRFNRKWNGKGYDKKGNTIYEIK